MSHNTACINMIKQQLRTGNVLDEHILSLYRTIPRETFVPMEFQAVAYADLQIPLPHQQRMMTPLEEGLLLQALALQGHETVLEIGTGTGFLTMLLSHLCHTVKSIDYYSDFTSHAQQKLAELKRTNVELITGDGSRGWIDGAPYDVIIFSSAMETIHETHRLQVLPGGKLFAIIGTGPVMQGQLHTLNHNEQWQKTVIFETNLPPLFDKLKTNEFVF